MESDTGEPKLSGMRVHAYDATSSVSWAVSAAIASSAAMFLAWRMLLPAPVPISTPSTVEIKRQQDHRRLILSSPTFTSRSPYRLVFRTTLLV